VTKSRFPNQPSFTHRDTERKIAIGESCIWIQRDGSVHETNPAWFDSLSQAKARLLEIVQGYPEYCEMLSALRREWQPSCLIHGDVKWDNFLIRVAESPDRRQCRPADLLSGGA
jgi:hypothetical protein